MDRVAIETQKNSHRNINGTTPAEAMKILNDKETTGTHWNVVSAYPLCFKKEYNANESIPKADPSNEIINSAFRPNESENFVVHRVPTS